jgi:hypothetical protein
MLWWGKPEYMRDDGPEVGRAPLVRVGSCLVGQDCLQRVHKTLSCAIFPKKISCDFGKLRHIMVYRHISKDLKERALWLISDGYAPEDICELFDISPRSVTRWKQNDHLYGTIIPPHNPMQCRPCILNGDMTHDLYTLLQEAPEMYLSEIQDWIALAFEVHISRAALHTWG